MLPDEPASDLPAQLRAILDSAGGPSLSRYLERRASVEQFREFLVHRSAYQLKEADPHSFAIPRLSGRSKVALVEIQFDEYGAGRPERQHARLFGNAMEALGLDGSYGAYLDLIPGTTLATVNAMSLFGLHRRLRGAIVGHLAGLEMDSTLPNRRYGNALRRLGLGGAAVDFFDEHVEADAVHESLAAHDLAAAFAADDPGAADDVLFGARTMVLLDERMAAQMFASWDGGGSSLRAPLGRCPRARSSRSSRGRRAARTRPPRGSRSACACRRRTAAAATGRSGTGRSSRGPGRSRCRPDRGS